jgi:hypothetical protein
MICAHHYNWDDLRKSFRFADKFRLPISHYLVMKMKAQKVHIAVALATTVALTAFTPRAFSQGGVPLWTNRYNGPGNGYDIARAIAVDRNGNVFVTGQSSAMTGNPEYATIKYSTAGVPLWTNRYHGATNGGYSTFGIAVDSNGNAFVTGGTVGGEARDEFATVAYSATGVPLWTNNYNGPGFGIGRATSIAVDSNGNVFVTGNSQGNSAAPDYTTLAYSATGMPLWTNRYHGPGFGSDSASAIAVDGSGNVFVSGLSHGIDGYDFATIKYSGAGVPLWTNRYDGSGDDLAGSIAVDNNGNVVVTGTSWRNDGSNPDIATIKYSSAGVPLWTNRYNGVGNGDDFSGGNAVDASGNIFVTGTSFNGTDLADYVTIKYSSAGATLWVRRYGHGRAFAIAVDSAGNAFVTGASDDYVTVAYSGSGLPLWTNTYHGLGSLGGEAYAIAVDRSGNVFVTGASASNNFGSPNYDFATIKYSSSLQPHATIARDGSGGLFLRYTGAPDVTYRLQRAASVTGTWSDLATNTAPASGLIEYHEASPPPGQAFYRVVQP